MVDVVGLRFVTEGEQNALRALERYRLGLIDTDRLQDRHVGAFNRRVQEELRGLTSLMRMRQQAAREQERVAQAYARLEASIDPTVAASQRLAAAQRTVDSAIEAGVVSADQGAQTMARLADALNDTSKANEMLRMKTEALARAYNPVLAAQMAYQRQIDQLNAAHRYGVLSADQLEAKLRELSAAYQSVGNDALRAQNFTNQFGTVTHIAGRSANAFGMIAQQVGYQVGDFFVQVQSGTNAFVAFGQQATQLAGLLPGIYGAVIGIGISVGTMLLATWDRTRRANDEAAQSANRYAEALKSLREQALTTRAEMTALYAGFESSQEGELLEAIRNRPAEAERLRAEAAAQIAALERMVVPGMGPSQGTQQAIADINALLEHSLQVLRDKTAEDERQLEAIRQQREERARLQAVTDRVQDLNEENALMAAQLVYMRQGVELEEARRRAEEDALLQQAMALANSTTATEEQREAAARFVEELVNGFNRARDLENQMSAATSQTEALANAARDAASAIDSIRSSTQGITTRIAALTAEMAALGAGMGDPTARASGIRAQRIAEARAAGESLGRGSSRLAAIDAEFAANVQLFELEERMREARRRASSGESGSGSGVAAAQAQEDAIARMMEQAALQRELLRLSDEERTIMEHFYNLQEQARSAGLDYTDEQLMGSARRLAAIERETQALRDQMQIRDRLQEGFADLFMSAIDGAEAFRNSLRGLLRSLLDIYVNRVFEQLFSSFGGALMPQGLRLPGRAIGGAVNAGQAVVVGENRPEIFVPNQAGRIYPNVSGGGTVVNVINNSGQPASERRSTDANGREIREIVIGETRTAMARGAYSNPLQARYGLTTRPVRRA